MGPNDAISSISVLFFSSKQRGLLPVVLKQSPITLMLAMPISWKGTLQQYAGRLHREHASKSDVLIYDYVDTGNPVLERMWKKRQCGYRAMGYQIIPSLEKLT